MVCVSVVVVVTGLRTEVSCVVVVVLWVGLSEAQPEINARARRAREETRRFFILFVIVVGLMVY